MGHISALLDTSHRMDERTFTSLLHQENRPSFGNGVRRSTSLMHNIQLYSLRCSLASVTNLTHERIGLFEDPKILVYVRALP